MTSEEKFKLIQLLFTMLIVVAFIVIIICLVFLIDKNDRRNTFDELTFYEDEFNICYDDDNYKYDIFAENTHYIVSQSRFEIKIDSETYIVLLVNEEENYNKAILFIGVGKQ